jgi:hypothetical protein
VVLGVGQTHVKLTVAAPWRGLVQGALDVMPWSNRTPAPPPAAVEVVAAGRSPPQQQPEPFSAAVARPLHVQSSAEDARQSPLSWSSWPSTASSCSACQHDCVWGPTGCARRRLFQPMEVPPPAGLSQAPPSPPMEEGEDGLDQELFPDIDPEALDQMLAAALEAHETSDLCPLYEELTPPPPDAQCQ